MPAPDAKYEDYDWDELPNDVSLRFLTFQFLTTMEEKLPTSVN